MLNGTGRGSVIAATPHVPAPVQVVYDTAPDVIP
jgi:hypothetical protein